MKLTGWIRKSRQSRAADTPVVTMRPESHNGHPGISIYEDGRRVAWGASDTAAVAAYQMSRAA